MNSMGFGRFGSGDLRSFLAGRVVSVQPVIGPFAQSSGGGGLTVIRTVAGAD